MPVFRSADAAMYETHGSRFSSYVAPARGSSQLCAWCLQVPPDVEGVAHRPDREEVLVIHDGVLLLTLDGVRSELHQGDVVLVCANSELQVSAGPAGATA
ncbi:MAG: cupin domain-containing protein [Actinomycetota bacterium]|nr:cupin domain-containing protein [Actinomycetota bacterium]